MEKRMIQVRNANLEVFIDGTGDTVVMIPGLGGDIHRFDELTPILVAAGYRTISINMRGAMGSTGPLEGLSLHDFAADVAGVIDTLGIAPVHLLGQTFGSRIAECVAVDRPELVKSLILLGLNGPVRSSPAAGAAFREAMRRDTSDEEWLEHARISLFSPCTDRETLIKTRRHYGGWQALYVAMSAANLATPLEDYRRENDVPTLVIAGLDDTLYLPANARAMREEFGDRIKLVELPDVGHSLLFEKPEVVGKEVVAFLQEQGD